jgi:hypothetical protein
MTPGILTTLGMAGGFYMLYLFDRAYAKRNDGIGIIHPFLTSLVAERYPQEVFDAALEEGKQRERAHYELSQRPIHRVTSAEYVFYNVPGQQANLQECQSCQSLWIDC